MKREKNYGKRPAEESDFHLRIPEGPAPRPQGSFVELRGGGGGHHNFQHFAQHCLNEQGQPLTPDSFKSKFTAWSLELEGVGSGIVLYPEGPAFKVLGASFEEGDAPVTYHAGAAHYTALMLCLQPTFFTSTQSNIPTQNEQLASYEVTGSWEPGGPVDFELQSQKIIETTGEVWLWNHYYYHQKVSLRIRIFPSPHGRNTIYLGGRLGTFQHI